MRTHSVPIYLHSICGRDDQRHFVHKMNPQTGTDMTYHQSRQYVGFAGFAGVPLFSRKDSRSKVAGCRIPTSHLLSTTSDAVSCRRRANEHTDRSSEGTLGTRRHDRQRLNRVPPIHMRARPLRMFWCPARWKCGVGSGSRRTRDMIGGEDVEALVVGSWGAARPGIPSQVVGGIGAFNHSMPR